MLRRHRAPLFWQVKVDGLHPLEQKTEPLSLQQLRHHSACTKGNNKNWRMFYHKKSIKKNITQMETNVFLFSSMNYTNVELSPFREAANEEDKDWEWATPPTPSFPT